jgi:predicted site-specific integrase-resolvase
MMSTKSIKLSDWAGRLYDPPPSPFVLRRWCRDGEISPQPERVGRDWYVREDARRKSANEPETAGQPQSGGLLAQLRRAVG